MKRAVGHFGENGAANPANTFGSGAIVLGCAGMADLYHTLQQRLGVPVIDGVGAAVNLAEGLDALGRGTRKLGDYAAPLAKNYAGLAVPYSPR